MKIIKRNAVIIAVLIFVCAAVYLNWSYNKGQEVSTDDPAESETVAAEQGSTETAKEESELYYTASDGGSSLSKDLKEYFDTVRLNRQQARAEASDTLNTVASAEGASQESIDGALSQMASIATWTLQESELENLILSKGFQECVAYISGDGISLTVAAPEGLSTADVAKLTDIVVSETDFKADQLKIVEIK